ncbi:MAG: hypothetical protein PHD51_02740 [Patescibacteria group bacterium]|nr:hypothetical protein [Patescibacteria group bacterium]MDD5490225.1 hypothetical protein [Patescibacteria group bacterium]
MTIVKKCDKLIFTSKSSRGLSERSEPKGRGGGIFRLIPFAQDYSEKMTFNINQVLSERNEPKGRGGGIFRLIPFAQDYLEKMTFNINQVLSERSEPKGRCGACLPVGRELAYPAKFSLRSN